MIVVVPVLGSGSADAATKPVRFKNCAALNKKFPHGVGQTTAKDKVSARVKPVLTFSKNNAWYLVNKGLDRDHDKIACEKK